MGESIGRHGVLAARLADVVPISAARQRLPGMERHRKARVQRLIDCVAVVHVDTSQCPSCGTAIVPQEIGRAS